MIRAIGRKVDPGHKRQLEELQTFFRETASSTALAENGTVFYDPADLELRLLEIIQIADGVDDKTRSYHLHRHDHSNWFRSSVNIRNLVFWRKRSRMKKAAPKDHAGHFGSDQVPVYHAWLINNKRTYRL